jgi:hypothetical protein
MIAKLTDRRLLLVVTLPPRPSDMFVVNREQR